MQKLNKFKIKITNLKISNVTSCLNIHQMSNEKYHNFGTEEYKTFNNFH